MKPSLKKRLRRLLRDHRGDACLITDMANIRYITGFRGSFAVILFDGEEAVFITDSRYELAARESLTGVTIDILRRQRWWERIHDLLRRKKIRRLIVEEAHFRLSTAKQFADTEIITAPLSRIRALKSAAEIKLIEHASRITEACFHYLLGELYDGMEEAEADYLIRRFFLDRGAEPAFPPIVAFGRHSALPHYETGRGCLKRGDTILIDFGAKKNGYCADVTRTLFWGRASQTQKKIYTTVRDAQQRALDTVTEGIDAAAVDRAARSYMEQHGYGRYFGHGLGHGIGLNVHEWPVLSPKGTAALTSGMVFTVEPGIYLPRSGGVRIEDNMAVTRKGPWTITRLEKELLIL